MTWDDLGRDASRENQKSREKWIGVYIGILAVMLALCGMGGGNSTKDSTLKNIEASNTWGFFQAKNIRRSEIRLQADQLGLMLEANPTMPVDAKKLVQAKIDEYRALDAKLTTDPDKKEGLDELFARAKALEADRDVALRKDPYFDWSQALLQIAIVLASVHLIIGNIWLLGLSGGLGAFGVLLMLNGFTLAVRLPFVG